MTMSSRFKAAAAAVRMGRTLARRERQAERRRWDWIMGEANMHVGFTGTSRGMSLQQARKLRALLEELKPLALHHGDCVGADATAHLIALDLGIPVILHPPSDPKKRAFCKGAIEERPPRPYLERNHDIVNETSLLIAAPRTQQEELRSGTWATIRYARAIGREVKLLS